MPKKRYSVTIECVVCNTYEVIADNNDDAQYKASLIADNLGNKVNITGFYTVEMKD